MYLPDHKVDKGNDIVGFDDATTPTKHDGIR
jgi:hypothetical protein